MHEMTLKVDRISNTAQIRVNGEDVLLAALDVRLRPDELVSGVAEVYLRESDVVIAETRLEATVGGKRMILVDPEEIEARAGHRVFAEAFRRILGL